ncbi:MAG: hypothetical protein M0011_03825 [Elusimicrobia bacterium]|nr:hypothetical protein [Elusimicrobiota bacterium]
MKKNAILAAVLTLITSGAAYAGGGLESFGFTPAQLEAAKVPAVPAYVEAAGGEKSAYEDMGKFKAMARKRFLSKDVKIELTVSDEGDSYGDILVRRVSAAGDKWELIKRYELERIPDSPQAIKSARKYVAQRLDADTAAAMDTVEWSCGGGPSYEARILVRGVAETVKTYSIMVSELSLSPAPIMDNEACRE